MTDLNSPKDIVSEGAPNPAPVPESTESGTTFSAESLTPSPSVIVPMMNPALEGLTDG